VLFLYFVLPFKGLVVVCSGLLRFDELDFGAIAEKEKPMRDHEKSNTP